MTKPSLLISITVFILALVAIWCRSYLYSLTKLRGKVESAITSEHTFSFGDRAKKMVALTFDADMTPHMESMLKSGQVKSWYNLRVVEILRQTNTPATLFLTGMWAGIYPEAVRELSVDPLFELGNHSYSHPAFSVKCYNLPVIKDTVQKTKEISQTQEILKQLTGKSPVIFRFPGGCYAKDDLSLVRSFGMTVIGWDVSSTDAFSYNTDKIINHVVSSVRNGSVVVFHLQGGPFAPKTAEALPQIINKLKEKGFIFVKVSDLINK